MRFLFPIFLIAGLSLAIPVLIHLFNLRRYKTVFFPHTRFLKNIQLHSRKQSQLRYKWLLAARLLFLAFLIFAFAQPFFGNNRKDQTGSGVQAIYLDNSYSMSLNNGSRNLLDIAKDAAIRQIRQAPVTNRFLLLTNDNPHNYRPVSAAEALAEVQSIGFSARHKNNTEVFSQLQNMLRNEALSHADLYYYSDFQQSSFPLHTDSTLLRNVTFYGIPVQSPQQGNVYIDTAWLNMPSLQTGVANQLIVRTRYTGDLPKEAPVLQLHINGQLKNTTSLDFTQQKESSDTLSFQVNDAGWQKIILSISNAGLPFDDTFRVSARSASNLAVLVLNENNANPFIQAAFRAYAGFSINQAPVSGGIPADSKSYNLVVLSGITRMDASLGKTLSQALQQGQNICIFPGKSFNLQALNEGLAQLGDLRFTALDTTVQRITGIQQESDLVRDMFDHIPENVQLPQSNWNYAISSGLSANRQSILTYRNGDPFLARYTPSKGNLYLCASGADLEAGNFITSYFFVPFLYQIAARSQGADVYAISMGSHQPAFLPLSNTGERNMVHLTAPEVDIIPPQRPNGTGVDVYADEVVSRPGFFKLTAPGNTDTSILAVNADRRESGLALWNMKTLQNDWKGPAIRWGDIEKTGQFSNAVTTDFPLWKLCVILALIMLAIESCFLTGNIFKSTVSTQQ